MSVIPLTIFFSLLLAGIFMVLFAHSQRRRSFASSESDSLLPLADEQPRVAHLTDLRQPKWSAKSGRPLNEAVIRHPFLNMRTKVTTRVTTLTTATIPTTQAAAAEAENARPAPAV